MGIESKTKKNTDPKFDGHLEKDLVSMSPKEKLMYISMQIKLKHFIETNVKQVPKKDVLQQEK